VEVCREEERGEAMEAFAAQAVVKVRATDVVSIITKNLQRVYITLINFIAPRVSHSSQFNLFISYGS
jgi:hypothetical protein